MNDLIEQLGNYPTFLDPASGFCLDISGMELDPAAIVELSAAGGGGQLSRIDRAHREMLRIEAGEIKNPDEQRKVSHFSDRLEYGQSKLYREVQKMAAGVAADRKIEYAVINGIGGSALGPQMVQYAINGPYWNELSEVRRGYFPRLYFLDNTDPSGFADLVRVVDFKKTMVVTISKSGGTRETRNNMIALEQAYAAAGLNFADYAVAITMPDSELDRHARDGGWLHRFPLADSIGGRTSETNVVGHLPAALGGIEFKQLLDGACAMDRLTRRAEVAANPAYQLALAWYIAGHGRGDRNLVVVPYSDRLLWFGRYLQQLVMESLGKELDRDGNRVCQGLTVYGNKGGTDAHAYIQQLNDGRDDFLVNFIEPLEDAEQLEIGDGLTMGDYLHAFKQGLINALRNKRRKVIDLQIPRVDEFYLGMLIALYERAVAFYAELININAFNQPGVQAYKTASDDINRLSAMLRDWIGSRSDEFQGSAAEIASCLQVPERTVEIDGLLAKLAVNRRQLAGQLVERSAREGGWRYRIFPLC